MVAVTRCVSLFVLGNGMYVKRNKKGIVRVCVLSSLDCEPEMEVTMGLRPGQGERDDHAVTACRGFPDPFPANNSLLALDESRFSNECVGSETFMAAFGERDERWSHHVHPRQDLADAEGTSAPPGHGASSPVLGSIDAFVGVRNPHDAMTDFPDFAL